MCIRDRIRQESDDEIGQLCQDFEEMRLRLKANAEEKVAFDRENKELISNISHDLKTPITAIKGYVEGIMDGVADTPEDVYKRQLAMSYFSTQHLSDLSATMAAASLIMIPASIVFIIFQKQFIKGITMTGMK